MDKLSKLIKNNGFYIYAVICLIIIILLTFFLVKPKVLETIDTLNILKTNQEILANLQKKSARLASIKSDDTDILLNEAKIALPSEKDPVSIFTSLDNLSIDTQVSIDNIAFNPGLLSSDSAAIKKPSGITDTASSKSAPALSFNISIKGEWENLKNLINKMLNSRRLFDISNIEITFMENSKQVLNSNLSIIVYYLPEVVQSGKIDNILPDITPQEKEILYKLSSLPDFSNKLIANISTSSSMMPQLGKSNLFAKD